MPPPLSIDEKRRDFYVALVSKPLTPESKPAPPLDPPQPSERFGSGKAVLVELYGGILAGARAVELLSVQITGTLYSEADKDSVTVAAHR